GEQVQPSSIPQLDYSRMGPNTAARLQSEAAGYGMGRKPGQSDEEWRSQLTGSLSQLPPGQASQPGNSAFGQAGGNGINSPTWSKGHALAGGMGNLAGLGSGLMGGLFGIGGGGNGQGAFQTIANQVMHQGGGTMNTGGTVQMKLPSGRLVQVPMTHLQEALQRGARQV